jgi:hypothetical protein
VRPACTGVHQITLPFDSNNCGRCQLCKQPQLMPNPSRTTCIARPLAKCNCI